MVAAGGLVCDDFDNPLWTGPGAAAGDRFLTFGNIEAFACDVAIIIQRIEIGGDGPAAGVAHAPRLVDPDFHGRSIIIVPGGTIHEPLALVDMRDLCLWFPPVAIVGTIAEGFGWFAQPHAGNLQGDDRGETLHG